MVLGKFLYGYSLEYLKIAYRVDKTKSLAIVMMNLLINFFPSVKVIVMAKSIDSIIVYFNGQMDVNSVVLPLLFFIITFIIEYILNVFLEILSLKFQITISAEMEDAFLKKINLIDFELFENGEKNDLFDRVNSGINEKFYVGFTTILHFIGIVIRIFSIIIIICSRNIFVGIISLFILLMIMPIAKKAGEEDYLAYEKSTKEFRRAKALREALTERKYVDERTLFSFTELLNSIWKNFYSKGILIEKEALKKNYFKTGASSVATALIASLITLLMVFSVKNGNMSIGVYISLVNAVFSLVYMMSWNFADLLEGLVGNERYMADFKRFMAIEVRRDIPNNPQLKNEITSIRFENVSFTYPNVETEALTNFSYEFKKGTSYALVGANGAGKTTIIKLMTGLYDSYSGEIFFNEYNIRSLSKEQIYSIFSIVYQDFIKYQLSIRDNIKIGAKNLELDKKFAISSSEDDVIYDILDKVDLREKINITDNGLDAKLGKLNDGGLDFSGGESQKLAIGRSLMYDANIYILDEATSALDPISEKKLYKMYNDLFSHKTSIVITHRLGNVENKDVILVLDKGNLKEVGSHEELINFKGLYYAMYEKQRGWYGGKKEI